MSTPTATNPPTTLTPAEWATVSNPLDYALDASSGNYVRKALPGTDQAQRPGETVEQWNARRASTAPTAGGPGQIDRLPGETHDQWHERSTRATNLADSDPTQRPGETTQQLRARLERAAQNAKDVPATPGITTPQRRRTDPGYNPNDPTNQRNQRPEANPNDPSLPGNPNWRTDYSRIAKQAGSDCADRLDHLLGMVSVGMNAADLETFHRGIKAEIGYLRRVGADSSNPFPAWTGTNRWP